MRGPAAFALLIFAGSAFAQAPPDQRPGGARPRDEASRMIEAYVVSNLQESLGLSDEQFVRMLPLVKKLQSDRRDYFQGRMRLLRELRRGLGSGGATEGQIAELLKELKTLDADGPARNRKDQDAIDAVLTPLQQAKMRVLEVEVEQKIRGLLSEIRRPRNPGARPGREPPPEEP